jgi:hypothetical protein
MFPLYQPQHGRAWSSTSCLNFAEGRPYCWECSDRLLIDSVTFFWRGNRDLSQGFLGFLRRGIVLPSLSRYI